MSSLKPEDISILVVEDEAVIAEDIRMQLAQSGYKIVVCFDAESALSHFARSKDAPPHVALMDINLPGAIDGIDAATIITERYGRPVIFLTGHERSDYYARASKAKPFAYFIKPFKSGQVRMSIDAAARLAGDVSATGPRLAVVDNIGVERRLVGTSNAIMKVRREIDVLGPSALPVVIVGPTGTGKEIVARELLLASARSAKPYITVNCASLGTLSDSELFGHARGSFTGAHCDTYGHIGSADGGTLLLDEVEALSMDVQAKLLRFLDSGEYSKVGESLSRHADVRILSASNRNLDELCDTGKLRRDLFYRLAGAIIRTTPLRERREDIPLLVKHFLAIPAGKDGTKRECLIGGEAIAALREYDWPGNARQLKQTIHLLRERHPGATVTAEDVADIIGGRGGEARVGYYQEEKTRNMEEFDKRYFTSVLLKSGGSAKIAMELTGMHKKNFYKKLKELGFAMRDFK